MLSDRVEMDGGWAIGQAVGEGAENSNAACGGMRGAENSNAACGDTRDLQHAERCELLHRRLKRIVKARGALDLQEAEALREAERMQMWRRYGYASLVNYLEMELGYSPRTAMERLRVANALPQLPQIAAAIEQGNLTFSGAKELTRVATPETETIWLGATKDMNTREVEQVVSGHRPGDVPTDPVDPKLQLRTLRYEVTGEVYALERQAKLAFRKSRGSWPSDSELLEAVFRAFIDGHGASTGESCTTVESRTTVESWGDASSLASPRAGTADETDGAARMAAADRNGASPTPAAANRNGAPRTRAADENGDGDVALIDGDCASAVDGNGGAFDGDLEVETIERIMRDTARGRRIVAPYQVAVMVCTECKRGWQDGAGEVVEMSPPAVERALCDCQHIGDLDSNEVARARQAIPPSVRLKVMRRDHGKCRVPGCRSVANLDVHHIIFRKHGGTNAVENLLVICESHHLATHDGSLVIKTVGGVVQFVHEGRNAFTRTTRRIDAARVLRERGIERAIVREVIERTSAHVGENDLSLEQWLAIAERYLAGMTPAAT